MRIVFIIALAIVTSCQARAQNSPANLANAEIFLDIHGSAGIQITVQTPSQKFVSGPLYADQTICGTEYEWFADTGSTVPVCAYTPIPNDSLTTITFEIDEGGGSPFHADTTITYYYFQCDENYEDSPYGVFMCPNPYSAYSNDLLILYDNNIDNEYNLHVYPFNMPLQDDIFEPIDVAILSNDWLIPHNLDAVCKGVSRCLALIDDPTFFISPLSPPTFALTNRDLTVRSGWSWSIDDVTLQFPSGKGLIVSGTLYADGATFQGQGSGSWAGISYESGSSGTIESSTITDVSSANGAIRVGYSATVTVDDVLLDNPSASSGIYLSGSSGARIRNSSIAGSTYGIKFTSAASARLWKNVIDDASIAVDVDYYSTANMQTVHIANDTLYGGSNELGNSGSGYITLRSQHSATVYAGDASIHGDNEFCSGNESDADASTSSIIIAKNNYWPAGGPDVYGNVTATPYNNERAALCSAVGKGLVASLPMYIEPPSDYDDLSAAINLMYRAAANDDDAAFAEVADLLKGLRASHSGTPMADAAMVGLYELSRLAGNANQRSYFEQLASTAGPDRATALGLLVQAYRGSGDIESARAAATSLAKLYPDQWHAFYAGLSIFEMDLDSGHFSQAATGLDQLVPRTKDDLQNLDAAWTELVRRSNGAIQRSPIPSLPLAGKVVANSSVLTEVSAYPNPFNPSTAISFDLMEKSNVDIKVYDALGRDIVLLAQDKFEPGRHTVTWDASAVPSGAYFIVIQASGMTKSLPITLLR